MYNFKYKFQINIANENMTVQYSFSKVNMTQTKEVKTKGSRQNKLTNRKERK
jgi:hypothetical protein